MSIWQIVGVDPDNIEDTADGAVIAGREDRVSALVRGCEAVADGWVNVEVRSASTTYRLVDPAVTA